MYPQKTLSLLALGAVCLCAAPATACAQETPQTVPTTNNHMRDASAIAAEANIDVNGNQKSTPSYVIGGENYLRIRDAALLLKDTESKFSVEWNAADSVVDVQKGVAYAEEASPENPVERPELLPASPVRESDKGVIKLRGYRIGGYNYYRLRDMAKAFAFQIDYDAANKIVSIQTDDGKANANSTNDASYPALSFTETADASDEIVRAKFIGYTDPFTVTPEKGNTPRVFRDAKFEVKARYKGSAEVGDVLYVRTGINAVQDGAFSISTGDDEIRFEGDMLLFLAKPARDGYITDEVYWVPVAGPIGVYKIQSDRAENIADPEKSFALESLETIDASVDPEELSRQQMQSNFESGRITEDEYDAYLRSLQEPIPYAEKSDIRK